MNVEGSNPFARSIFSANNLRILSRELQQTQESAWLFKDAHWRGGLVLRSGAAGGSSLIVDRAGEYFGLFAYDFAISTYTGFLLVAAPPLHGSKTLLVEDGHDCRLLSNASDILRPSLPGVSRSIGISPRRQMS